MEIKEVNFEEIELLEEAVTPAAAISPAEVWKNTGCGGGC